MLKILQHFGFMQHFRLILFEKVEAYNLKNESKKLKTGLTKIKTMRGELGDGKQNLKINIMKTYFH